MVVGSPVCYHFVFFILKPLPGDDYSLFVSFPRSCYRVWWSLVVSGKNFSAITCGTRLGMYPPLGKRSLRDRTQELWYRYQTLFKRNTLHILARLVRNAVSCSVARYSLHSGNLVSTNSSSFIYYESMNSEWLASLRHGSCTITDAQAPWLISSRRVKILHSPELSDLHIDGQSRAEEFRQQIQLNIQPRNVWWVMSVTDIKGQLECPTLW